MWISPALRSLHLFGFSFVPMSQGKEEGEGAGGLVAEAGRPGTEARNSEQWRHHSHLNMDVAPSLHQAPTNVLPQGHHMFMLLVQHTSLYTPAFVYQFFPTSTVKTLSTQFPLTMILYKKKEEKLCLSWMENGVGGGGRLLYALLAI